MSNSGEAPNERYCYGNCGVHVGRYLVYSGLCHKTAKMHIPGMGCSISECIK